MLDAGLTPNVVTYTSLMVVLRRGGQTEKSIKILDLMKSKVRTPRETSGCTPYLGESTNQPTNGQSINQ